jgi:hypothetical protein
MWVFIGIVMLKEYYEEACVTAVLDKSCCDSQTFFSTKDLTEKVFALFKH